MIDKNMPDNILRYRDRYENTVTDDKRASKIYEALLRYSLIIVENL